MGVWETIVTALGGAAILVGAAAWLAKKVIVHFLDKDIEAYKVKLQADTERELEAFKTELRLTEFRSTRLHEERARIIAELYSRLVKLANIADRFLADMKLGLKPEATAEKAYPIEREFHQYFQLHRIYFSEELSQRVTDYHAYVQSGLMSIDMPQMDDSKSGQLRDAYSNIVEKAEPIRRQLEGEFREILGVVNVSQDRFGSLSPGKST